MVTILASMTFAAEPNLDAASTGDPVQVFEVEGRTRLPLCATPCTATLDPDTRHRLLFQSPGHPTATKTIRLSPGERVDITVKPGKNGVFRTGNVLSAIGLIGVSTGVILTQLNSPEALPVLIGGTGTLLVALPFQISGATKVKARKGR